MYNAKLLFIFLFCALIAGCSSLIESAPSPALNSKITADFSPDIEVGNATKGSSHSTIILGFTFGDTKYVEGINYGANHTILDGFYGYGPIELTKSAAAYKALKSKNADILIAPRYTVDEFNFFYLYRTIDVDVTGFTGTVKSVKQK